MKRFESFGQTQKQIKTHIIYHRIIQYQWKQTQHQITYGFVNLLKTTLSNKYKYQSHMERCKVYKDHSKANCIDDEFKQQLKQDILNEFKCV